MIDEDEHEQLNQNTPPEILLSLSQCKITRDGCLEASHRGHALRVNGVVESSTTKKEQRCWSESARMWMQSAASLFIVARERRGEYPKTKSVTTHNRGKLNAS
jgi:hypothetical protein